jgi:hypothetical protein
MKDCSLNFGTLRKSNVEPSKECTLEKTDTPFVMKQQATNPLIGKRFKFNHNGVTETAEIFQHNIRPQGNTYGVIILRFSIPEDRAQEIVSRLVVLSLSPNQPSKKKKKVITVGSRK